jgi:hypothetical protein
MPGSMSDLAARMGQRKQRLEEDQQYFDRVNLNKFSSIILGFYFILRNKIFMQKMLM